MIDDATRRLVESGIALSDDEVAQASLLPGWSRGHVLAHVTGNAGALRNLLIWARTGVPTPAYLSQQARNEAIEAGAGRPAAELAADVTESAAAFRAEAVALPPAAWPATVSLLDGVEFPATQILTKRLVEVELHHTDLGCGYHRADWPASFASMDLPEPMRTLRATRQLPPSASRLFRPFPRSRVFMTFKRSFPLTLAKREVTFSPLIGNFPVTLHWPRSG